MIDDSDERAYLEDALGAAGMQVQSYPSARSFLEVDRIQAPACVVADLHPPDMHGFELQREIRSRGLDIPVLFLTANEDILAAARLMHEGDVDFLSRPLNPAQLVGRITSVLDDYRRRQQEESELQAIRSRISRLTPRESEVTTMVMQGKCNKEISQDLGISVRTVEKHRASVMDKLGAHNVADLCRIGRHCEKVFQSLMRAADKDRHSG